MSPVTLSFRYIKIFYSSDAIAKRLKNKLYDILREENIEYVEVSSIEELYEYSVKDRDIASYKDTLGLYLYNKSKTVIPRIVVKVNKYTICNILTFAHELGHHFGVTRFLDTSEEFADTWAYEFVKRNCTEFEKGEIHGFIKIMLENTLVEEYDSRASLSKKIDELMEIYNHKHKEYDKRKKLAKIKTEKSQNIFSRLLNEFWPHSSANRATAF